MFNFKKNLNFILAKIIIGLKENKEYKINLYSAIIVNLVVVLIYLIFFMIFNKNFPEVLNFTRYDFLVYGFLILSGSKIYHIFVLKYFSKKLLRGDLNLILTKPINPFLFSIFSSFRGPVIIVFPMLLLITLLLIYFGDYSIINYIPAILFFIFSCIYYMIFFNIFESLAFFIKENYFFTEIIYRSIVLALNIGTIFNFQSYSYLMPKYIPRAKI